MKSEHFSLKIQMQFTQKKKYKCTATAVLRSEFPFNNARSI